MPAKDKFFFPSLLELDSAFVAQNISKNHNL